MKIVAYRRLALMCAIAMAAGGCSSPEATRDKYVAQANASFEQKQYPQAILAYRNALKADPLYAPARQKLAEAYEATGEPRNAAREFVRAADLLPKDANAQLVAARYLLMAGQFEDSATRTRQAIEIDPKNADAHILLGRALAGTKDLEGAIEQIQEAIDLDPESGAGHVNMGALLLAQGRKAEAQTSFETAVRLEPRSVGARLALANFHLSVGALKDAEDVIDGALQVSPESVLANRAMAMLLIATDRASKAEPYVQTFVRELGTPEAELALAKYYLQIKRIDTAKPILERLTGFEKTFAEASVRLGSLDYVGGRKEEAHRRLDQVIERAPRNAPALTVKANWLLAEQQPEEALGMSRAAVKADPRSPAVHYMLGRTLMATGDKQGAEEAFTEVLRLNPRAGAAQRELARLSYATGRPEAGVQFAQDAVKNLPGSADARVLLVRGLLGRRDLERASVELAALTRALPDNPTIIGLNGTLRSMKKDPAGARRDFERALQADPDQMDALAGLTGLDVDAGQIDRARQRLGTQLQRKPNNTALLLLAAQTDMAARDYAAAEQRLRQIVTLDASHLRAYELLANTYLRLGKLDEARKEFEAIAQRQPRAAGVHTFLGMIHHVQHRPEEAEKAYRQALEANPQAAVAANNLAYMYADREHNLEEALALARSAAVGMKDDAASLDTVGWVYYKKGQPDLAIPQFEASVRKDPKNAVYLFHLGLAYWKAGEGAKARRALDEALRLNPSFDGAAEARRVLAGL